MPKKVKGRKRNDGRLPAAADGERGAGQRAGRDGADQVVRAAIDKYPSLEKLYVDSGYAGTCAVEVVRIRPIATSWVNPDQGELFPVLADSKGFVVCRNVAPTPGTNAAAA